MSTIEWSVKDKGLAGKRRSNWYCETDRQEKFGKGISDAEVLLKSNTGRLLVGCRAVMTAMDTKGDFQWVAAVDGGALEEYCTQVSKVYETARKEGLANKCMFGSTGEFGTWLLDYTNRRYDVDPEEHGWTILDSPLAMKEFDLHEIAKWVRLTAWLGDCMDEAEKCMKKLYKDFGWKFYTRGDRVLDVLKEVGQVCVSKHLERAGRGETVRDVHIYDAGYASLGAGDAFWMNLAKHGFATLEEARMKLCIAKGIYSQSSNETLRKWGIDFIKEYRLKAYSDGIYIKEMEQAYAGLLEGLLEDVRRAMGVDKITWGSGNFDADEPHIEKESKVLDCQNYMAAVVHLEEVASRSREHKEFM